MQLIPLVLNFSYRVFGYCAPFLAPIMRDSRGLPVIRIIGGRINERLLYWSSVEGPGRRGRPLGRWEDRVKEYVSERE